MRGGEVEGAVVEGSVEGEALEQGGGVAGDYAGGLEDVFGEEGVAGQTCLVDDR